MASLSKKERHEETKTTQLQVLHSRGLLWPVRYSVDDDMIWKVSKFASAEGMVRCLLNVTSGNVERN